MAAGRYTSTGHTSTFLPWRRRRRPSLPVVVVLPDPWMPHIRYTDGLAGATIRPLPSPPSRSTRESLTILKKTWWGVRLLSTSSPMARSLTSAMNLRATSKFTSASSRVKRSSRRASWIFLSEMRPWPLIFLKMPPRRSEKLSSILNHPALSGHTKAAPVGANI